MGSFKGARAQSPLFQNGFQPNTTSIGNQSARAHVANSIFAIWSLLSIPHLRARSYCKCEAPGNKAIESAVTKHHLAPSTTPTVERQNMCDPLVEDLTAPCMCALFFGL